MEVLIASLLSLVVGVGLAITWMKRNAISKGATTGDKQAIRALEQQILVRKKIEASAPVLEADSVPHIAPAQVVVTRGDREVMSMMVLTDTDTATKHLQRATKLPEQAISGPLRSLIEPLLQAAPSVGTAAMANSGKLMEVVINGQMLAASDGNGLRAIAKAGKGFEHAKLYEPSNLQNVANAAVIWQLASIVVAQKHLADISASLKRVESKVEDLQSMLEEKRFAVIRSAMNYLDVARKAIESGEFLERTRNEMERVDIELDRAGMTLVEQIRRIAGKGLERDTVGCEGEYKSASDKHQELSRLAGVLALCNEVRLVNWYICSVYPDNSKMLTPRLEQISKRLSEDKLLQELLLKSVKDDCELITADFTSEETISLRRSKVKNVANEGQLALNEGFKRCGEILIKLEKVRADRQEIIRLVVETRDGAPTAAYLVGVGTS